MQSDVQWEQWEQVGGFRSGKLTFWVLDFAIHPLKWESICRSLSLVLGVAIDVGVGRRLSSARAIANIMRQCHHQTRIVLETTPVSQHGCAHRWVKGRFFFGSLLKQARACTRGGPLSK